MASAEAFRELLFEPLLASSFDDDTKGIEEEIALDVDTDSGSDKLPTQTVLNGHLLPICVRGKVRDNLTGIALKEISSEYKKKDTFVVIGRGSRILYRFGEAESYVKWNGGWRNQAIAILTHGVFNYFMVFAILVNCFIYGAVPFEPAKVSLPPSSDGIDSVPAPPPSKDEMNYALVIKFTNVAFVSLFILEFMLKILARGLLKAKNPFSTLRISWSWLDVFVIVIGILSILNPTNRTLAALNAFRALKLIPLLPSWLGGYDLLFWKAWRRVLHVSYFAVVIMFLLGIWSMGLYYTTLQNKCVLNTTAAEIFENNGNFTDDMFLTYADSEEYRPCGNFSGSLQCPPDHICIAVGQNPRRGKVGFDDLGLAEFTLINLVVQDFGEYVYEKIWLIFNWVHVLYGVLVFFLGTFAIGVLLYAVLGYEFLNGFSSLKWELDTKCRQHKTTVWSRRFDVAPTTTWGKWREKGRKVVMHKNFDLFITLFILMDVITFALDHHDIEEGSTMSSFLTYMNSIIHSVYILECLLKLIFIGVRPYMKSCWNRFDFAVVIWILLNRTLNIWPAGTVFTVLKVVPRWPVLNFLFNVIGTGIWTRWAFGISAVLLFVFSYIGYVSFGEKYSENAAEFPRSEIPRWNMIDFWHSVRLIFRAVCGEWIETLWDLLLVAPGASSILFIATSGIIGNLLVTCLCLCIILTTYNQLQVDSESHHPHTSLERLFWPITLICRKIKAKFTGKSGNSDSPTKAEDDKAQADGSKPTAVTDDDAEEATEDNMVNNGKEVIVAPPKKDDKPSRSTIPEKIMAHFAYKIWVCSLIIILTILVAYEQLIAEIIFICYFALEIIARAALLGFGRKLLSLGLFFDSLMVINSVLALSLETPYGLWNFGTFRLLMIISRVTGLRLVRDQFWRQIRLLWQYLLATLFLWFVFTLIAMTLFKGGFSKCFDGKHVMEFSVISNKADCAFNNLTWERSPMNFDSVNEGLWTLFLVAIRNGWLIAVASAEDMSHVDGQLKRDAFPTAMIYFMIFLIIGVLYPFATMVGILYKDLKSRSWIQVFEQGWPYHKEEKSNNLSSGRQTGQSALEKFVHSQKFELGVCFVILVDCIIIVLLYNNNDGVGNLTLEILRILILVIFVFELILRGITVKKNFFKQWLNVLLLVVVLMSAIELIMVELAKYAISADLIRALRLFHLLAIDSIGTYKIPELGSFRKALVRSFPVLACIFVFYGLLYASFASFGATEFGGIEDFSSWNATTSLFKIATISGLEGVYYKIAKGGNCLLENEGDVCGNPILGVYYVAGFLAITIFAFVNLYLAFILEIIEQLGKPEPKVSEDADGKKYVRVEEVEATPQKRAYVAVETAPPKHEEAIPEEDTVPPEDDDDDEFSEMTEWGPVATFAALDKNKDGRVSKEEFVRFRVHRVKKYDWFGKFDRSGDGLLDMIELRAATDSLREAWRMLIDADTNKDGRISREELLDYVARSSRQLFEDHDTDKDGYMNKAEFLEFAKYFS